MSISLKREFPRIEQFTMCDSEGSSIQVERGIEQISSSGAIREINRYTNGMSDIVRVYPRSVYKELQDFRIRYSLPSCPQVQAFVNHLEHPDFEGDMIKAIQKEALSMHAQRLFSTSREAEEAIQIAHSRQLQRLDKKALERRIEAVTGDYEKFERVVHKNLSQVLRTHGKCYTLRLEESSLYTELSSLRRELELYNRSPEVESLDKLANQSRFLTTSSNGMVFNIPFIKEEATANPEGEAAELLRQYEKIQFRQSSLCERLGKLADRLEEVRKNLDELDVDRVQGEVRFAFLDLTTIKKMVSIGVHQENLSTKAYLQFLDLATKRHTYFCPFEGRRIETTGEFSDEILFKDPSTNAVILQLPISYAAHCIAKKWEKISASVVTKSISSDTPLPLSCEGVYALVKNYSRNIDHLSSEDWQALKNWIAGVGHRSAMQSSSRSSSSSSTSSIQDAGGASSSSLALPSLA